MVNLDKDRSQQDKNWSCSWDSKLYAVANNCIVKSQQSWGKGEVAESWGYTIPARLAYLCSAIVDVVTYPFAFISFIFGSAHALFTWNLNSTAFQTSKTRIVDKTNRFFLSALGAIISPALTYKYRACNLTPYCIALRISFVIGALIYYLRKP